MDTAPEHPATVRLAEQLDALPEDEREAVAEDALARIDEAKRVRALIEPALRSVERGEAKPLEGHASFMERMKRKHGF